MLKKAEAALAHADKAIEIADAIVKAIRLVMSAIG